MRSALLRSFVNKAQATLGLISVCALTIFFQASPALAASSINNQISYQARLLDPSGFPVADGTYNVKFSLYDAPTGGTRLWTANGTLGAPTSIAVSVANGLFTVLLGDTGQNTLDTVDWNSDALYLGVTIEADAEMTPRRRMAAAPQAFNARQLQGMYASGTAFGTSNVFAINQTSNTAATGTRSALEVKSAGTSNANDFLIRGINDLSSVVFSVNRQGGVTSTGVIAANTVTTSQLFVAGSLVCLSNGTNCSSSSGTSSLQQVTNVGATTSNMLTLFGGFIASSSTVTSSLNVLGSMTYTPSTGTNPFNIQLPSTTSFTGSFDTGFKMFSTNTNAGTSMFRFNDGTNDISVLAFSDNVSTLNATGSLFILNHTKDQFSIDLLGAGGLGSNAAEFGMNNLDNELAGQDAAIRLSSNSTASSSAIAELKSRTGASIVQHVGSGSPEGAIFANAGSIFFRDHSTASGTQAYLKTQNNNSTGWVGIVTTDMAGGSTPSLQQVTNVGASTDQTLSLYNGFLAGSSTVTSTLFVGGEIDLASTSYTNAGINSNITYEVQSQGSLLLNGTTLTQITSPSIFFNGSVGPDLIPITAGIYNIGSVSSHWATGYFDTANFYPTTSTNPVAIRTAGIAADGQFVPGLSVTSTDSNSGIQLGTYGTLGGNAPAIYFSDDLNTAAPFTSATSASVFFSTSTSGLYSYYQNPLGGGSEFAIQDLNASNTQVKAAAQIINFGNNSSTAILRLRFANSGEGGSIVQHVGDGSPEGTVFANNGSIYFNINPSSGSTAYLKTQNANSTGWKAIATTDMISSSDTNWTYDLTSDTVHNASATTDIVLGSAATSTGAPAYFDLAGSTSGTSDFYFGFNTSSNVLIGASSTTLDFMKQEFNFNFTGGDLFVGGNIGSVSSIYTNGAFVAGVSSTYFGNGYIAKTDPGLLQINTVSGTNFTNGISQIWSANSHPQKLSSSTLTTSGKPVEIIGNFAYVPDGSSLKVFDISNPNNVILVLTLPMGESLTSALTHVGNILYLRGSSNTFFIDVTAPHDAFIRATFPNPTGLTSRWKAANGYLYAERCIGGSCPSGAELVIYKINSSSLTQVGAVSNAITGEMAVAGSFVYALDSTNQVMNTIDVSVPTSPVIVGTLDLTATTPFLNQIAVSGRYAYITDSFNSVLLTVDISDDEFPALVKTLSGFASPSYVSVAGRYAYVSDAAGPSVVRVVDVQTTTSQAIVNSIQTGTDSLLNFVPMGRYGFAVQVGTTNRGLTAYDLQGTEIANLTAHDLEAGQLDVNGQANFADTVHVQSSLSVGDWLSVGGNLVCLANGANCANNRLWSTDRAPTELSRATASTNSTDHLIIGKYAYVIDNKNIDVYDISDPNAILSITSLNLGTAISDMDYDGNTLYAMAGISLKEISLAKPAAPTVVSTVINFDGIKKFRAVNGYLYASVCSGVCPSGNDFQIYRVTTSTLTAIGTLATVSDSLTRPWIRGHYAFTINPSNQNFNVIDISDPTNPTLAGFLDLSATTPAFLDLVADDNYAYLTDDNNGVLYKIDLHDPTTPSTASALSGLTDPAFMTLNGRYLYLSDVGLSTYDVIDVQASTTPSIVNQFVANSNTIHRLIPVGSLGIAVEPDTVSPHVAVYDLDGEEIANLTAHSFAAGDLRVTGNAQFANSVQVQASLAVGHDLTVGDQHVCLQDGTNCQSFTAASSVSLSVATTVAENGNPRNLFVDGKYMYVADGAGQLMEIFDVSTATNPVLVSTTTVSFGANAVEIFASSTLALVTIDAPSNTLDVYDVSNPASPVLLATQGFGTNTPGGIAYANGYAYVLNGSSNFTVVNLTNPSAPVTVATTTVGSLASEVKVDGNYAYVTNFSGNSLSIVDITNPLTPTVVSTVNGLSQPINLDVSNGYAYVANSQFGNDTLSIIDVHDPVNPVFVTSTFAGTGAGAIKVSGHYAYVANTHSGGHYVSIIDIRDPMRPQYVSLEDIGAAANNLDISGRYLFTANFSFQNTLTVAALNGPETSDLYAPRGSLNDLVITQSLSVAGQSVCLEDGTNCPATASTSTLQDVTNNGATTTRELYLLGGSISSSSTVTSSLTVLGSSSTAAALTVKVPAPVNVFDISTGLSISATNSNRGVSLGRVQGLDDSSFLALSDDVTNVVGASGSLMLYDHVLNSYSSILSGVGGIGNQQAIFTQNDLDAVGATAEAAFTLDDQASNSSTAVLSLRSPAGVIVQHAGNGTPEGSIFASSGSIFFNASCASSGTCAYLKTGTGVTGWKGIATTDMLTGVADLNWVYNLSSDSVRNATATTDIILGSSATSTGAPVYFDLSGGKLGTSAVYFGNATNTNVVIGGTSTTNTGLNGLFAMDGDDLFVHGNIGSASSVYTNGEFVAGPGSTHYGDGYIDSLLGPLTLYSNSATGTSLVNSLDNKLTSQSIFRTASSTQLNGSFPIDVAVQGHYAYVLNQSDSSVSVVDVANPSSPVFLTNFTSGSLGSGDPRGLFVSGHYLYVANEATGVLSIFDISRPSAPSVTGELLSLTSPWGVDVQGDRAYVISNSGLLYIVDVSNPASPVLKDTINVSSGATNVVVQGRYAYVANTNFTFSVLDLASSTPSVVGTGTTHGNSGKNIRVEGDYLVTGSSGSSTVDVFDVHTPSNPSLIGTVTLGSAIKGNGNSIYMSGRYVYALNNAGINVIDIGNPFSPSTLLTFAVGSNPNGLFVAGRYAYTMDSTTNLLYLVDISGIETNGLLAHSADLGSLQVQTNASIFNDASIGGSLSVGLGGIFSQGSLSVSASSTSSTAKFRNFSAGTDGTEWGAYIDRLLVGSNANSTGSQNYREVISYATGTNSMGLCIDDTGSAPTCPTTGFGGASILTDGVVGSNAFDLAETYSVNGAAAPGDVLVMDDTAAATVKTSPGTPYDSKIIGVVSTDPGFLLGWNPGARVALTGHVPTHVNMENGPIHVGDPLTTSHTPGQAMKATKPGMVIGYALEDVNATGTADVFVAVGYSAGAVIGNNGSFTTIADNLLIGAKDQVSASTTTADSWGLTFRGQAWDASSTSVVNRDYTLLTDVISATSSAFSIQNSSGTDLFTLDENGNATVNGDLQVGGKLYLSSRGSKQNDYYVFLDQSGSSTYIGTNADGFQSLDTYDFAERFSSPDALEPGDLVVVKDAGGQHVQRSMNESDMLVGIVSTRPAFVAGRPATDTYPIALTGRVPTKVSTLNGEIKAGDALAPSTLPGIAVKATKTGPIVGLALEDFVDTQIGKINVYVNPGWWTAPSSTDQVVNQTIVNNTTVSTDTSQNRRGLAKIVAGSTHVHVSYDTINAYPFVQVTPRGLITGSWGTDGYTDNGFDIILSQAQSFDTFFSWQVQPLDTNDRLYQSDGTYLDLNQMTGEPIGGQTPTSTDSVATTTASTPTSTDSGMDTSTTVPVVTDTTTTDTASTATTTTTTTVTDVPADSSATTTDATGTIDLTSTSSTS